MTREQVSAEKVTPAAIRLAVEWLAANANGVSLVDWEPRSQTLLNAANEIERLQAELKQLRIDHRKEMNQAARDAMQDVAEAAANARLDALEEGRDY